MHLGPDADAHGMVFAKRHRIWCGEQHFPFVSDVLWYNYLKLKTGGKGYVAELEGESVAIRYNLKVGKNAINETKQRRMPFCSVRNRITFREDSSVDLRKLAAERCAS